MYVYVRNDRKVDISIILYSFYCRFKFRISGVSKWGLPSVASHSSSSNNIYGSGFRKLYRMSSTHLAERQRQVVRQRSWPAILSNYKCTCFKKSFRRCRRSTTVKNFNSSFRTGILFVRKVCRLSVCCFSGTKSGHA